MYILLYSVIKWQSLIFSSGLDFTRIGFIPYQYGIQCFFSTAANCNISLNGIHVSEKSVPVLIGDSLMFQCTCRNSVTVQWKLNGTNITTNINATNGMLNISAVKSSDNGNVYHCNSSSFFLTVTSKLCWI